MRNCVPCSPMSTRVSCLHWHSRSNRTAIWLQRARRPPMPSAAASWDRDQRLSHQETLEELRAARRSGDLRAYVMDNEETVGIDFLLWVSETDGGADANDSQELDLLIGEVICIREGLDASSSDAGCETSTSAGEGLLPSENTTSLARADDLSRQVVAAKQAAVVNLIGRQELPTLEDSRRVEHAANSSNVAARIMEVLLQIPAGRARRAALVDALTPPPLGSDPELVKDDQEELLYTSPFTLLAVDTELAKDDRTTSESKDESSTVGDVGRLNDLMSLRDDIMAYLNQPGVELN